LRQSRNVDALRETHRDVDEQQQAQPSQEPTDRDQSRSPRHYGALHESHNRVDDRDLWISQHGSPGPQRSWSHHGGMAPQQGSAMEWIRQNDEYGLSGWENRKAAREGQGMSSPQSDQAQKDQELAEARAAVEEARRQEATERSQQQQRDRSGPER